jgi:REP element-mobilizing transposase RayT
MKEEKTLGAVYTAQNCRAAYELRWSLTVFWRQAPHDEKWWPMLRLLTEKDGVRLLRFRSRSDGISQFLVSTRPEVAPFSIVRSVKGRLYHILRENASSPFQRNYCLLSVGKIRGKIIERYVASQLDHHRMASDERQRALRRLQYRNSEVDLGSVRRSGHGQYNYNLHLTLVNTGRWMEIREEVLRNLVRMAIQVADERNHLLSRIGVFPDHMHLALGANLTESPNDVAYSYLNHLAGIFGGRPVFQFGYFVRTFGHYDLGAIYQSIQPDSLSG